MDPRLSDASFDQQFIDLLLWFAALPSAHPVVIDERNGASETISRVGNCVVFTDPSPLSAISATLDCSVLNPSMIDDRSCLIFNRSTQTLTLNTVADDDIDDGTGAATSKTLAPGCSCQLITKASGAIGTRSVINWQMLRGGGSSDTPPEGSAAWGSITGTLSDQTDLQTELDGLRVEIGAGSINTPPPSSDWSWVNQGTSTVSTSAGFPFFNVVGAGTDYIRGYVRPKTGNFTLTIGVQMRPLASPGGFGWGILLSDGTKYIGFNWMDFTMSSNGYSLRLQKWNTPTSFNGLYQQLNLATSVWLTGTIWYRVVADATNYTWYYSFDKCNWVQFDQHSRGDFLGTLSHIGVGGHSVTSGLVSLISWEEA